MLSINPETRNQGQKVTEIFYCLWGKIQIPDAFGQCRIPNSTTRITDFANFKWQKDLRFFIGFGNILDDLGITGIQNVGYIGIAAFRDRNWT